MNSRSNMFKLLLIQTRRRIYQYFLLKTLDSQKKIKKNEKLNIEERRTIKPPSFDETLSVVTDGQIQSNLLQ